MQRKRLIIVSVGSIIGIIAITLVLLFIVPYFKPIIINGIFVPYQYTIYKDHVIINDYLGDEEVVSIPSQICFHKVTVIGELMVDGDIIFPFYGNQTIRKVIIPDTVIVISECFKECTNLEEVIFSRNIKEIDKGCFYGCTSLKSVTLPDGLERIGGTAFGRCEKLTSVVIPDSVQRLEGAFVNCTNLKDVIISDQVAYIDGYSFKNTFWRDSIQDDFIITGKNCLIGYNGLDKEVYVPDGVEYIGEDVFAKDEIETIHIPRSVSRMNLWTFAFCHDLQCLIIENDEIILDEDLRENPNLTIIANPGSTAEQYAIENKIPYKHL